MFSKAKLGISFRPENLPETGHQANQIHKEALQESQVVGG